MKAQQSKGLIYHSLHGRDPRGCLPFFILVGLLGTALFFLLVRVKPVEDVVSLGRGEIIHQKNALLQSYLTETSPLLFKLPRYADPAQQLLSPIHLPISRAASLQALPEIAPDAGASPSPLLEASYLLALPAELEQQAPWAKKAAPVQATPPVAPQPEPTQKEAQP